MPNLQVPLFEATCLLMGDGSQLIAKDTLPPLKGLIDSI
jgi:hypothetical protein